MCKPALVRSRAMIDLSELTNECMVMENYSNKRRRTNGNDCTGSGNDNGHNFTGSDNNDNDDDSVVSSASTLTKPERSLSFDQVFDSLTTSVAQEEAFPIIAWEFDD